MRRKWKKKQKREQIVREITTNRNNDGEVESTTEVWMRRRARGKDKEKGRREKRRLESEDRR
jgi:hypothetical protein